MARSKLIELASLGWKPQDIKDLWNELRELAKEAELQELISKETKKSEREQLVDNALDELGLRKSMIGREYIREAVILLLQNPEDKAKITQTIYPKVATKYQTTIDLMLKATKYAIEKSEVDRTVLFTRIFGNPSKTVKTKEFIIGVHSYLQ